MVLIEEVSEQQPLPASEERLLDAKEIEGLVASGSIERPSVRFQLESLAKKLRKESEALKRLEESKQKVDSQQQQYQAQSETAVPEPTQDENDIETGPSSPPPPSPSSSNNNSSNVTNVAPPPPKIETSALPVKSSPLQQFQPIDRFSFDFGGYNAPFVSLYVPLPGVGSIPKDQIQCQFTKSSFDLVVNNLNGKSYRLFKDNLEKDIDPTKSKYTVKSDEIRLKLAKIKTSEYGGYDFWSKLTDKNKTSKLASGATAKDDPSKSIMQLMKDMYDEGDDNIRKVIGETMLKQQRGELGKDNKFGSDSFSGVLDD